MGWISASLSAIPNTKRRWTHVSWLHVRPAGASAVCELNMAWWAAEGCMTDARSGRGWMNTCRVPDTSFSHDSSEAHACPVGAAAAAASRLISSAAAVAATQRGPPMAALWQSETVGRLVQQSASLSVHEETWLKTQTGALIQHSTTNGRAVACVGEGPRRTGGPAASAPLWLPVAARRPTPTTAESRGWVGTGAWV